MCTMFTLCCVFIFTHHSGVTMSILASQITGNSTVSLSVCLYGHQRKHESPRYSPFVTGIHRRPVDSPHKGQVTRKSLPFDGHHAWYSSPLQRWGLLSQFPSFPYFPSFFSALSNHVDHWISRLHLTGVTTAQLWWHLSNMNVIQRI